MRILSNIVSFFKVVDFLHIQFFKVHKIKKKMADTFELITVWTGFRLIYAHWLKILYIVKEVYIWYDILGSVLSENL